MVMGCFPAAHRGFDAAEQNGRAEHGPVQNGADSGVRTLPHLVEVVFLHALDIGRDGGTLDGDAVFFRGVGGGNGHLIFGAVALREAQVIIFGLQVDKGQQKLVLNHLPQDTRHLVAVHLDQRRVHLNLFHHRASLQAVCVAIHQAAVQQNLAFVCGPAPASGERHVRHLSPIGAEQPRAGMRLLSPCYDGAGGCLGT